VESTEIRRRFLDFFESRGHTVVPSASLIMDDPTLLFVNAGMVPFKPYFLGQQTAPFRRAVSVQKCVRTLDIEEVGKTTRHGTFFQMDGNFSFGDYFKEQAIQYAFELLTRPIADGGYGMDESRIWASVFYEDDEAYNLWLKHTSVPEERIVRRGMKENFWSMGVSGPCGPCSEIHYDRGPEHGREGGPEADEDRYLEVWNLVFMQYERGPGGVKEDYPIIGDLPSKNIDTGMGQERLAYLLQGKDNLYEIDQVFPVIARAAELAGIQYGGTSGHESRPEDVRLRVVGDHIRSSLMLIGDGVTPSNETRGYVLRRLLRRAVRSMRLLGVDDPVLPELLPISKDLMARSYPELGLEWERISTIAYAEEEAFRRTLRAGLQIFDLAASEVKAAGGTQLSGAEAFKLHDTYGFPIDLTVEMAAEHGLGVDRDVFAALMTEQRERAKADARAKKTGFVDQSTYRDVADRLGRPVEFTGYQEVVSEGQIQGLLIDGAPATSAGAGANVEVILDRTPFYAENGGQLADRGVIELDMARLDVLDVQEPIPGLIVHRSRVVDGEINVGIPALGRVDVERRRAISRAHTATHMVHKAVREALGETASQAGSENAPGRFRFDFAAPGAVRPSVLRDVEERVNALISDDLGVHADIMSLDEARRSGAMMLFGEKYGDEVRVISVGDWARELCGGTHAQRSGQLGLVKLLHESSIGQGVRRVEALVGVDAYRYLAREHVLVAQLTEALKAPPEQLPDRVAAIIERLRAAEKEIERMRATAVLAAAAGLAAAAEDLNGVAYVAYQVDQETTTDELRKLAFDVRGRIPADRPGVVTVAGDSKGRPVLVTATNEAARQRGLNAGELVRVGAAVLGGGGGGKDDVAQGGGNDVSRIGDALGAIRHAIVTGGAS
jgi:alanyl-tRNA synthetase